jgi:predicted DsbA family dithiol-disulfide isomerase
VNLARVDELVRIAGSIGLPENAARDVLESRTHKARVDADWERSGRIGVTAVPTFVFEGRGVVGAQSYETLEELVVQGGARRRE